MARGSWNHNTHFHPLAVRHVTATTTALDVGCGEGLLTRQLAEAGAARVLGVDLEPAMVAQAVERAPAGATALEYRVGDLLGMPTDERFDLVTCVATLHHLELEPGLRRLRVLTAPGGRLVVVGLAGTTRASEVALSLATVVVDPLAKAARGYWEHPAPVQDPAHSYETVARTAATVLPGSRFRRRMYYRYTLEWTAPQED